MTRWGKSLQHFSVKIMKNILCQNNLSKKHSKQIIYLIIKNLSMCVKIF